MGLQMVERKLFNHPYFHFSLCSQIICDQICLDWQFVSSIVTFGHFLHDWSIIEDNANWKNILFINCAQIASSDGGSEGRDSDIWTEYGGEVEIFTFCQNFEFFLLNSAFW